MKKTPGYLTLALAGVAVAATAFAARLPKQPTFQVYGVEALTTTASNGIVAQARHEVHKALGNWTTGKDGQPQDLSFLESGQSWSATSRPDARSTSTIGRGKTTFMDKDGHHVSMEVVSNPEVPVLVFLSNDGGAEAQKNLLNTFLASLQNQGVKMHQP